jgi:hypothetical protein
LEAAKLAAVPPLVRLSGKLGIDAVVAKVPEVGKVTLVAPVIVKVLANAPLVAKFPAKVRVEEPLLTPVPPYVEPISVPFQTPVVIVPILAKFESVVTAVLTKVPVVGSVTLVIPVEVKVVEKAPEVIKSAAVVNAPPVEILPPRVIVLEFETPVPPYVAARGVVREIVLPVLERGAVTLMFAAELNALKMIGVVPIVKGPAPVSTNILVAFTVPKVMIV